MSIEKLATRTANWINNSERVQSLFSHIGNNPAKTSVNTSNAVNFVIRPIATMASSIDKWDGAYCSSSSISSGIAETLTSKTLLQPFNKQVQKSTNSLRASGFFNSMADKYKDKAENIEGRYKSAMGRLALIGLVFVNSMIKFAIHPPLAKGVKSISDKVDKRKLDKNV